MVFIGENMKTYRNRETTLHHIIIFNLKYNQMLRLEKVHFVELFMPIAQY